MNPKPGSRRKIAAALFVSLLVLVAIPAEADAWTSPPGVTQVYYYPGPPPGGYLAGCIVESGLYKAPAGDWASIKGTSSAASRNCLTQGVQGVFLNTTTNTLFALPSIPPYYLYSTGSSTAIVQGPLGAPIFGANHTATNSNGWGTTWSVLVF